MARVEVHWAAGEARFAGQRVSIAGHGSGLRLLVAGGLTLRAVRFGERGRLARAAGAVPDAPVALATALARLAADGPIPAEAVVPAEILALHLAGAGSGAPGFAEEVGLLGGWIGWSPREIAEAEAAEVDALAMAYLQARREQQPSVVAADGWVTLRLDEPTGGPVGEAPQTPLALRDALAGDLLRRARALPDLTGLKGAPRPAGGRASAPQPGRAGVAVPSRPAPGRASIAGGPLAGTVPASPPGDVSGAPVEAGAAQVAPAPAQDVVPVSPTAWAPTPTAVAGSPRPRAGRPRAVRPTVMSLRAGLPEPRSAASARAWWPETSPRATSEPTPAEDLARIYPAIFGGERLLPLRSGPLAGPGEDRAIRAGPADPWPEETPARRAATRSTSPPGAVARPDVPQRATTAAAGARFDLDPVARALHRAADLRGVAP